VGLDQRSRSAPIWDVSGPAGICPVFLSSEVSGSLIGTPAVAGVRGIRAGGAERESRCSRSRPGQAIVSFSGV
jgi:hypothetical protein